MPGIATGESYSFAEGRLYLYASASGTTSGSGIGFARNAQMRVTYGWRRWRNADGTYARAITGQQVDLSIESLYSDRTLFNLTNGTAAVNAKFEGLVTGAGLGKSAQFTMISGDISECQLDQSDGEMFRYRFAYMANNWTVAGQ